MMHGRPPVNHPWPLNHVLAKVDISDPHTFLAIKRGILQYAWLKPILGIATIVMKSTGVYQEGYLGLTSGYLWAGILYNVSVTLSLYSLAMFWVCMSQDLKPFRPVPKFLCIKLIIFASYWQGFFLSILQWLGAIPNDVDGYTVDNLAAAIQDALISFEMPLFAIGHWYAFSWHDYADITISAARMPVKFALRDAFGVRDLIEDTKETFAGSKYEYRDFDTRDNVLTHEESDSRVARMMEGMRYERGGKGKYWIPRPGQANSRTPLLGEGSSSIRAGTGAQTSNHGTVRKSTDLDFGSIDPEDERLFESARVLEFGDWNVRRCASITRPQSANVQQYPVVTAHIPSRERWMHADPNLITTSTNRNLLHPTRMNKQRREKKIEERLREGKHRASSSHSHASGSKSFARAPVVSGLIREHSAGSSKSAASGRSQLVDLVVEDSDAEETERVRARKDGGAAWNVNETKHFVYACGPLSFQATKLLTCPADEHMTTRTKERTLEKASSQATFQQRSHRVLPWGTTRRMMEMMRVAALEDKLLTRTWTTETSGAGGRR